MRGLVEGKRWLLLTRWVNLTSGRRQDLNKLFALNRHLLKAYLLKESLDRLYTYHYEGAMLNYLQRWIGQLRWQRLRPFQKLADMLLKHLDVILNYCRTRVPMGIVEAVNGNIKTLLPVAEVTRTSVTCCSRLSAWRRPRLNLSVSGKLREIRLSLNSRAEPIVRRPSPLWSGEGSMAWRRLADAACHSGGVVRAAR
jgi:hypothetical protein